MKRQRGAVMLLVLVLIGVMTVTAMFSLRLAITGEAVARNRDAQAQALQAAELALRWCESQIGAAAPAVALLAAPDVDAGEPVRWRDLAAWNDSSPIAVPIPEAARGPEAAGPAPQCMVEEVALQRMRGAYASAVWMVTARGRSPGWVDGVQGAEVWLQSTVSR